MCRTKLTNVSELPPDAVLLRYIREAVALTEQGVKVGRPKREPKPEAEVPADLLAALKKNEKARTAFEAFSPSHPPRVRGVDHRGQAGGDPAAADRPGRRVAGRGEAPALEVPAEVGWVKPARHRDRPNTEQPEPAEHSRR
jgi:hypothetical protein